MAEPAKPLEKKAEEEITRGRGRLVSMRASDRPYVEEVPYMRAVIKKAFQGDGSEWRKVRQRLHPY